MVKYFFIKSKYNQLKVVLVKERGSISDPLNNINPKSSCNVEFNFLYATFILLENRYQCVK